MALINSGLCEKEALKSMGLTEVPPTGRELYKSLLKEWRQANCHSLLDVACYYIKASQF